MKPSVYLETTIISYLAAWPSRDLVLAGHQQLTRDWWETRRGEYDLCISEAVVDEASKGDPEAARRRLEFVQGLRRYSASVEAVALAEKIVREAKLPSKAGVDALHVAIAATNGVETLLTWNCKHIASVRFRPGIESVCRKAGFVPPLLATPIDLLE